MHVRQVDMVLLMVFRSHWSPLTHLRAELIVAKVHSEERTLATLMQSGEEAEAD